QPGAAAELGLDAVDAGGVDLVVETVGGVGGRDLAAVAQQADVGRTRQAHVQGLAASGGRLAAHLHTATGTVGPEREAARGREGVDRDVAAALAQPFIYKGAVVLELAGRGALAEHVRVELLERALVG